MIRSVAAATLVALLGCRSHAAPVARVDPVRATLDAYLTRAEAVGFSGVIVVARGDDVYARGLRESADTRFLVASISKTFTAAAIALLVSRGQLAWDRPLGEILPDVPDDKRAITIAQLLSHTAGLPDEYRGETAPDRDAAIRAILDEPLAGAPGAAWSYANDGYTLLAAIVEVITGERFEDVVRRDLFEPAGLTAAAFVYEDRAPPGAVAHGWNGDVDQGLPHRHDGWARGAGGLITTAADLLRWARALDHGDVVPRAVLDEMTAAPVDARPGIRDGLGWFVVDNPRHTRALYHGGNETPLGFTAELRRYVDEDVVTVLLCNAMIDDVGLNRLVRDCLEAIVFGGSCAMPPPVAGPGDPSLAGTYRLDGGGGFEVAADPAGVLWISADGQGAVERLRPAEVARREANAGAEAAALADAGGPGRVLGTAAVDDTTTTTVVALDDGRRVRVIRSDDGAPDVLPTAAGAARTPLVRQADGSYLAWSPFEASGVRVRFDGEALVVGDVTATRNRDAR